MKSNFPQKEKVNEYHQLEIQEIYQRIRDFTNIRIQITSFIGTANIAIIGVAINTQRAGLFFHAACTIVMLILADSFYRQELVAYYYRGLELEKLYSPDKERAIIHTYIRVRKNQYLYKRLAGIADVKSWDERIKMLRRGYWQGWGGLLASLALVLLEVGFGWAMYQYFNWLLF